MSGHSFTALAADYAEREPAGARPGEVALRSTLMVAATVAGALIIAAGAIAAVTHLTVASAARRWLAYPFTGIPARPGEAVAIFLHNVRALAAVGGLLLIAQSPHWAENADAGPLHRATRRGGEALLAAGVSANILVVGASLGAYGSRMIRAVLPHGPVELGAYALALALYIQGRDKPRPASPALAIAPVGATRLDL